MTFIPPNEYFHESIQQQTNCCRNDIIEIQKGIADSSKEQIEGYHRFWAWYG
jgi:hypothetical protein